jgi:predicted nuclease of predicted toxin-antitoxin system
VKLLFDQSLSPELVKTISDLFPGSCHVQDIGMGTTADSLIWNYARENGFAIVSKDSGFHERSIVHGHPPKVIWVRSGNCATEAVIQILRRHAIQLQQFAEDPDESFLALS